MIIRRRKCCDPMAAIILNGLWVTAAVELLSRSSLSATIDFIVGSPLKFIANVLIIMLTLSLSLLAKRRNFVQAMVSVFWLILGVINHVVLIYRMTPISMEDLKLLPALKMIMKNYFSPGTIAVVIAGVVLLIVVIVILFKKMPKDNDIRRTSKLAACAAIGAIAVCLVLTLDMVDRVAPMGDNFENLAVAYDDYGFAYVFSGSMFDEGIAKPEDYSQEKIEKIAKAIRDTERPEGSVGKQPDIIMIQLESFFDPVYAEEYYFSKDPIPFFRSLKRRRPKGFLDVPVVGAGTVNTEFEILTGMSTSYFGAGEFPYNTIMQTMTCESIPNILRGKGYTSTAIHNNTGTFYHRDKVFSQMGFDRFIPMEYMYGITRTPTNWAKDDILADLIMDTLYASDGPDFIYTITVQSHGSYPDEPVLDAPKITVENAEGERAYSVEYYSNQVYDLDRMLKKLAGRLTERGENAILVLYGDHLPALGITEEKLLHPDLYDTEYVIWSTPGVELEDTNVKADSLGTKVLSLAGEADGILPGFHLKFDGTEEYTDYLHQLEYDMLYGEGYIYQCFADELTLAPITEDGMETFVPTELTFGLEPITVTDAVRSGEDFLVKGSLFNEFSHVEIDGSLADTEYVDSETLKVTGSVPKEGGSLRVIQCDENMGQIGNGSNTIEFK